MNKSPKSLLQRTQLNPLAALVQMIEEILADYFIDKIDQAGVNRDEHRKIVHRDQEHGQIVCCQLDERIEKVKYSSKLE
jgi:hypothetical protein